MVPARPGIAFIEFESEHNAGQALTGLQGFKVKDTHSMSITFAKK